MNLLRVLSQRDCELKFLSRGKIFARVGHHIALPADGFYDTLHRRLVLLRKFLDHCKYRSSVNLKISDVFEQDEILQWIKVALSRSVQTVSSEFENSKPFIAKDEKGVFTSPIVYKFGDNPFVDMCYWSAKFTVAGSKLSAKVKNCQVWDALFVKDITNNEVLGMQDDFNHFCRGINTGMIMSRTLSVSDEES